MTSITVPRCDTSVSDETKVTFEEMAKVPSIVTGVPVGTMNGLVQFTAPEPLHVRFAHTAPAKGGGVTHSVLFAAGGGVITGTTVTVPGGGVTTTGPGVSVDGRGVVGATVVVGIGVTVATTTVGCGVCEL